MAITAQGRNDEEITYDNASKWVIDDSGRLHIIGDGKNVASYNNGDWSNVREV